MSVRLAGINLPQEKRIEVALVAIYGIGRRSSASILKSAKIDPNTKTKDLSDAEVTKIRAAIEGISLEGDLRRVIQQNVRHLQETGSYRGTRHRLKLPVRGQRTKTNARTKRGKRVTMGSGKVKLTKT